MRAKLVLLYAVILSIVIAGFSIALEIGVRRSLVEALDQELQARARSVVALSEFEDGEWHVETKAGLHHEYGKDKDLYYVLADSDGKVVLSSQPGLKLAETDGARENGAFRELTLSLQKLRDREEGGKPISVRIACGKSMAGLEAAMTSLTATLWIVAPLVLILSMAGGWLLVSRALRPIDRMARTAEKIQATDLSQRIDAGGKDELARLARTLNDMFDRLQSAFDRQTRFTADASHELRTPLSVIAGNVELALKRPRDAEDYREILKDVGEATDRMRSIVEGLLTLARADAKIIPLKREPVSLTALADEFTRMVRPLAEKQDVKVSVQSEGDVVVLGDRDRLKELVSNLITNAIRYNRPGGAVTVRLALEGGRGTMTVDDTGIGIPAEDLPHIFERFYRVDKARSREVGGSGLGLAIVKWIVEAHAGTISATSTPGTGSRFLVTLPAS